VSHEGMALGRFGPLQERRSPCAARLLLGSGVDLRVQAASEYSLIKPPSTGQRRIRCAWPSSRGHLSPRPSQIRTCRVGGGISAAAPTDPDVKISLHPARTAQSSGRGAVFPVREQAGRTFYNAGQPCPCTFAAALQTLVFPFGPADEMAVYPVGCGYSISVADLACGVRILDYGRDQAFFLRLRCGSVLVDQAAEDLLAPEPGDVEVGGSHR
jgi:hypothetical protein